MCLMNKQHPQFDPNDTLNHFDFALLKLSKPAKISEKVGVVCLPMNRSNLYVDEELTVSGWGRIIFDGMASPVLRAAQVKGKVLFLIPNLSIPRSTPTAVITKKN